MPSAPLSSPSPRLPIVDAARGVAILAMVAYHLSWDLDFLGFAQFDLFTSPFWLAARTAILGSFLLLVGVSLVLAVERGFDRRRYLRRLGLLAAAAAAVSAVSYVQFPDSPIFFGVLHHIAVASVLGLAFVRLPFAVTLALGVLACALPSMARAPLFDEPWLRWIGLMTFEPDSNDYVPLFPWFGIVLWGIALGRLWRGRGRLAAWRPADKVGRALAWAGRFSLPIYLVHQPALFGALSLVALLAGSPNRETRDFLASCESGCTSSGERSCAAQCRCIADELKRAGLWQDVLANRYVGSTRAAVAAVVLGCKR
ncbi:MAG TPA: heparan-alpha-glucosaminide N-acetyltransferase [Azospirillum sp.]|nr:heparan-alpha-glucosaminide N-acetyltransferase [Azospirillum sp.]